MKNSDVLLQVDWKKGDEVVKVNGKYEAGVAGAVHSLTILDVDGHDVSAYTAVARGKTSTAKLAVDGEWRTEERSAKT
jgi:hypothetical protein